MVKGYSAFLVGVILCGLSWIFGVFVVYRVYVIKPDLTLLISFPIFTGLLSSSIAFVVIVGRDFVRKLDLKADKDALIQSEQIINKRIDDIVEEDRDKHNQLFVTTNQTNKIVQMIFLKMGGKIDPEELNDLNSDLTIHNYRDKKK